MRPTRDVQWLAGLLEGKGCFTFISRKNPSPMISLGMADQDVVESATQLMAQIGGRLRTIGVRRLPSARTFYTVQLTGLPAAKVMVAIRPYLHTRRGQKVDELLSNWAPAKYKAAVQYRKKVMSAWPFHE